MFVRTANVIEMAQVFYPIISLLGHSLKLVIIAGFRKNVKKLLAEMQEIVNLSKIAIVYGFASWFYKLFTSTEDANCTIYGITDVQVAFFCKIYERLVFIGIAIYTALPAILEFLALKTATEKTVHLDVGLFYDL